MDVINPGLHKSCGTELIELVALVAFWERRAFRLWTWWPRNGGLLLGVSLVFPGFVVPFWDSQFFG